MPSASGIRAGRAYVEIYGEDDQLDQALQQSDQKLTRWGERLSAVGGASASLFARTVAGITGTIGAITGAVAAISLTANPVKRVAESSGAVNDKIADMTTLIDRLAPLSDELWRFMSGGMTRSIGLMSSVNNLLKAAGPAAAPLLDVITKLNSASSAPGMFGKIAGSLRESKNTSTSLGQTLKNMTSDWVAPFAESAEKFAGTFRLSAAQRESRKGLRSAVFRGDKEEVSTFKTARSLADAGRLSAAFDKGKISGVFTAVSQATRRVVSSAGNVAVAGIGTLWRGVKGVPTNALGALAQSFGVSAKSVDSSTTQLGKAFQSASSGSSKFFQSLSGKTAIMTGVSAGLVGIMSAAAGLDLTTISSRLMRSGSFASSAKDLKKRGNAGISDADVSNAKQLSNAMEGLFQAGEAAWAQVGAAVAPLVTQSLQATTQWVAGIARWLNANRDLTASLFSIVKTVLTVGTAATIGGKAWTLLAPVVSALMPIFAAILSPVGLLAAGFLAAVAAVSYFSGAAGQAIGWLGEQFNSLNAYFGDTWSGIVAAVSSGDLSTAGEIAMLGIRIAFADAMNAIGVDWAGFTKFFIDLWDTVTSNIARLFADPWNTIQNLWINGMTGMLVGWHRVMQGVMDAFSIAKGFLSKGILALLNLLSGDEITMGFDEIDAQTNAAIDENAQRRGEAIDKVRQDSEQMLGELDAKRNDRSKQIDDELTQRRADRDQALKDSRAKDQAELKSMRDRLGQAIDRANDSKAKPFEAVLPTEAGSSLKTRIAGAVNAAAISGIGPSSAVDQIAKHTKATAEGVVKLTKKPPLQPLAWGS